MSWRPCRQVKGQVFEPMFSVRQLHGLHQAYPFRFCHTVCSTASIVPLSAPVRLAVFSLAKAKTPPLCCALPYPAPNKPFLLNSRIPPIPKNLATLSHCFLNWPFHVEPSLISTTFLYFIIAFFTIFIKVTNHQILKITYTIVPRKI